MKKVLIFSVVLLVSCTSPTVKRESLQGVTTSLGGLPLEVYTIDGCQYIGSLRGQQTDWASHKGNCNNPIHLQNK